MRREGEVKRAVQIRKENTMAVILAVLVLALIVGGLGFAVHVLWWIALVVLVLWLLGFFLRGGAAAAGPRRRWHRW
jgi:membrane protein YdbS with pleckstrin-like domain